MAQFLVYRHGSNAANQSMTNTMAVAIVEATTIEEGLTVAVDNVLCYNNQTLELVEESELTDEQQEDWNEILTQDANLRSAGEDSIVFVK